MPTPRPISRQFFRCFTVASRSLGNHSNGADTCRPSARITTSESLVKDTPTASAAGLTPKVLIPRNYKLLAVLFNHFSNPGQLVIAKSGAFSVIFGAGFSLPSRSEAG